MSTTSTPPTRGTTTLPPPTTTTPTTTTTTPTTTTTIELIFIRHGESEENQKMRLLQEGITRMKEGKFFTFSQLTNLPKLFSPFHTNTNSKLSPLGIQQIQEMKEYLEMKLFWKQSKYSPIDSIVYSPLERTQLTCFGIIPSYYQDRCHPLEELKELSAVEYFLQSTKLDEQIYQFRKWLHHQYGGEEDEEEEGKERETKRQGGDGGGGGSSYSGSNGGAGGKNEGRSNMKRIIIVGHARYFQRLLIKFSDPSYMNKIPLMYNCDMWKVHYQFNPHDINSGRFTQAKLLFRSPLAANHLIDQLFNSSFWKKTQKKEGMLRIEEDYLLTDELLSEQDHKLRDHPRGASSPTIHSPGSSGNDGEEEIEEPTCRICQARKSETPDQVLLKPCLCSGSLAYVHLECLNQWRSTSDHAHNSCSICHYKYRMKKNFISDILLQKPFIALATLFLTFGIVLGSGYLLQYILTVASPHTNITKTNVIDYLYGFTFPSEHFCHHPKRHQIVDSVIEPGTWKPNHYIWKLIIKGWIWVACTPFTFAALQCFLLGCPTIASIGHIAHNVRIFRRAFGNEGGWGALINVSFLWFGNDLPFMLRLYTVIGCFIFMKDLMEEYSMNLRKWSHSMGNEVLNIDD